jgi:hypothetical protein
LSFLMRFKLILYDQVTISAEQTIQYMGQGKNLTLFFKAAIKSKSYPVLFYKCFQFIFFGEVQMILTWK